MPLGTKHVVSQPPSQEVVVCGHSCFMSSTDVREKGPSVSYWDGNGRDAHVCHHLQDFSGMIPICVYSFVLCVCVCVYTWNSRIFRENKTMFEQCGEVIEGPGECDVSG